MATTGGAFVTRLSFVGSAFAHRSTTGTFSLALRFVSGPYARDISDHAPVRRKTLFPRQDVPAIDLKTGCFTEVWYRILQYDHEVKLGGDLAPTIPQVAGSVSVVQGGLEDAGSLLTNVVQFVQTNAAVQAASNEVQIGAGLPGAAQVPAPVLTVPTATPRTNEAVE